MANFGRIRSSSTPFLYRPFDRIAALDVSEPEAGIVVIAPREIADLGVALPS